MQCVVGMEIFCASERILSTDVMSLLHVLKLGFVAFSVAETHELRSIESTCLMSLDTIARCFEVEFSAQLDVHCLLKGRKVDSEEP